MMLRAPQISLLIVPTVALGENQHENFQKMKVKSIFLRGKSTKADYNLALNPSTHAAESPQVIIITPETLFGTDTTRGILDKLDPNSVRLVAIDEVHLVYEWAFFRDAFTRVGQLKDHFKCPIIALTATIKPAALEKLQFSLLRSPTGDLMNISSVRALHRIIITFGFSYSRIGGSP